MTIWPSRLAEDAVFLFDIAQWNVPGFLKKKELQGLYKINTQSQTAAAALAQDEGKFLTPFLYNL